MTIERHVITGEYPPDVGGVGDYTALVADALAGCGERVHVWCPGAAGALSAGGVTVHRELGRFRSADLRRMSAALQGAPRRLLVQWVPHAFGRRSLNLTFCRWLRDRAAAGDEIDVIVHEPFLPFRGSARVIAAAVVHRVMAMLLLRAAARVWVVTPAWERCLRPYAPQRELGFKWLPVPSTIPIATGSAARQQLVPSDGFLIGSFATGGPYAEKALRDFILPLLVKRPEVHLLLVGRGSDPLRAALAGGDGAIGSRIHATGCLGLAELSLHVLACDVAVQPYADGVCGRRTSAMAFLAHGRPLVTTDGRFTERLWREGAVALVPAATPERLTEVIGQLMANDAERDRLARAGRDLYEARLDVRHTAAALHQAVS